MASIYTGLERRRPRISLGDGRAPCTSPGSHKPLSLPRYLPVGLTYGNNLFLKNLVNAYDSFLNVSTPCREQLTT
jgi:hypothetical protein